MENICILCKLPITKINDEHIVPYALLGDPSKTENVLISNHICLDCNNKTGKEVDSEFLNNQEIKALRLLHKDFLNKDSNPKLKLTNVINVRFDDHEIPCDLIIDKIFINSKKIVILTGHAEAARLKPNIKVRFVKHEPKIFPKARSICFFLAAANVTDSSGREVPMAIIVAPITSLSTLKVVAIFIAESTT